MNSERYFFIAIKAWSFAVIIFVILLCPVTMMLALWNRLGYHKQ